MLQIHSDLKELLSSLFNPPQPPTFTTYQNAYIRFRGLAAEAGEHNEVYRQWAERFLLDVNDESGDVVKMHESIQELNADMEAFANLIEKVEAYHSNN